MEKVTKNSKKVRLSEIPVVIFSGKEARKLKRKPGVTKLPEEVWLIIFKELKDDKDLQNCCLASLYMDTVLTSSKPLWQFKKAVSSIAGYLPLNVLLKCRSVCKQWREDINAHLQSRPYYPYKEGQGFYNFTSTERIREFLRIFSDHSGNPLVDRTVQFYYPWGCNQPDFDLEMNAFMNRFGAHVWNLSIEKDFNDLSYLYSFLHSVLTKATDSRHLGFESDDMDLDNNYALGEVAENALFASLIRRPLPFISTLESLCFTVFLSGAYLPSTVMLPYATQLKSLSIGKNAHFEGPDGFYARGLINLKELNVDDIFGEESLEKLREFNSPIEKMRLGFEFDMDKPCRVSLALVIDVVHKFPLKDLSLQFFDDTLVENLQLEEVPAANMARREIPTLKKLHISQLNNSSYNFLRSFPNLESLTVEMKINLEEIKEEAEENVQLYRMLKERRSYQSNIWRELPKLKIVQFVDTTFGSRMNRLDLKKTREEYESRQNRNE